MMKNIQKLLMSHSNVGIGKKVKFDFRESIHNNFLHIDQRNFQFRLGETGLDPAVYRKNLEIIR